MSKISIAVLTVALLFALPAVAGDDRGRNYTPRQLAHCVMARAKVSPNESYKVAFKACREQLETVANDAKTQTVMDNVDTANEAKR
jgi:surface antigen